MDFRSIVQGNVSRVSWYAAMGNALATAIAARMAVWLKPKGLYWITVEHFRLQADFASEFVGMMPPSTFLGYGSTYSINCYVAGLLPGTVVLCYAWS